MPARRKRGDSGEVSPAGNALAEVSAQDGEECPGSGRNVNSDSGTPAGGTPLTVKLAKKRRKPFLVVDLDHGGDPSTVRKWIRENKIGILNVAGPRERKAPGIHAKAVRFLRAVLKGRPSTLRAKKAK